MENELVLIWVVGAIGVPFINMVKNYLKNRWLEDGRAVFALYVLLSVLISVGVMFFTDGFVGISVASFAAVLGQVIASSTLVYNLLKKG
jgi:hypothetical protein